MATWKADLWVNSNVGQTTTTVEASSYSGALDQIYAKHGDVTTISNLREVSSGGGSLLSDAGDMGGWFILGCIVFATWLIMEFWWIIVPVAAICGLGWIAMKTEHLWNK
jgi:hypothetical protein